MENYAIRNLRGFGDMVHRSLDRLLSAGAVGTPALVLAPGHVFVLALVRVHKPAPADSEDAASVPARAHCQNQAEAGSPPQQRVYPLDSSALMAGLVAYMKAAVSASEVELVIAADIAVCYCRRDHLPPRLRRRHSHHHDRLPYPRTRSHSFQNCQTGSIMATVASTN